MKTTRTIHLGGMGFTIDDDAYERLNNYLESIKQHFANEDDAQEITNDIEDRIAELLHDRSTRPEYIIAQADIEAVIAEMGTVGDITGEENSVPEPEKKWQRGKKLLRDMDNVVIGGVCSGIAAYLGIDATIIRILFLISLFAGGTGLLLYCILWIILPKARTATDKMQMRGQTATIAGIEKAVKEKWNSSSVQKEKNSILHFFERLFALIGQIAKAILNSITRIIPIAAKLIGLALLLCSILLFMVFTIILCTALFKMNNPFFDIPLLFTMQMDALSLWFFPLLYGSIIIPICFLFILGLYLLTKRAIIRKGFAATWGGLWIVVVILTIVFGMHTIPQTIEIYNNQPQHEKEVGIKYTQKFNIEGNYNVQIHYSERNSVIVYGTREQLDENQISMENGILHITQRDKLFWCIGCNQQSIDVAIYTNNPIEFLTLNGYMDEGQVSATVDSLVPWSSDVEIILNDHANLTLDPIVAKTIKLYQNGNSTVRMNGLGYTQQLDIELTGSSVLYGQGFSANTVNIQTSGASSAVFHVVDSLSAFASGASRIEYIGSPKIENRELSGSAVIKEIKNISDIRIIEGTHSY